MNQKITACLLAITLLSVFSIEALAAPSLTDAQKKQKELQGKISSVISKKKEANKALITNKQKRAEIVRNLEEMGFEKLAIEEKLAQIDSAIDTLTEAISLSEKEYDAELALFQERIVVMYQRSKTWQGVELVLESDNVTEFYKNRNAMKSVSKADQDMMQSLEAKRAEIEDLKLQKLQEEETTQEQLEAQLTAISEEIASRSLVDVEIRSTKEELAEIDKNEQALEAEANKVSALIKELKLSLASYTGGDMKWPAPGNNKISSPYGNRMHPIFHVMRFHSGIDIHANKGDSITAAAGGTVIYAGARTGYGNTVIIDHGGKITTLYAHIMKGGIKVHVGQIVHTGDVIARVGSTGWSTGPHLHFEYRLNGDTKNPVSHLGKKQQ
jgi:murein DD-endopeptidase MepM/ murein hydrolase activator NlpD